MGERLTIRVFKGPTEGQFRGAFAEVVERYGGSVFWNTSPDHADEDLRTSHNDAVHAVYLPGIDGADYLLCLKLGSVLSVPWLEIRIQEGSLWDYSLFAGDTLLHNFSVLPEYWDDDAEWIAERRGDPQALAAAWGIDCSHIENYLKPWCFRLVDDYEIEIVVRGKAYASDKHKSGDIWQMHDFVRALGAHDPTDIRQHGRQHRIKSPSVDALRGSK